MAIARFTRIVRRTCRDTGQVRTCSEWIDAKGSPGRTEGPGDPEPGSLMAAHVRAAELQGLRLERETW